MHRSCTATNLLRAPEFQKNKIFLHKKKENVERVVGGEHRNLERQGGGEHSDVERLVGG